MQGARPQAELWGDIETTGRSRLGLTLNIPYVFKIINGLQVISLVIVWERVMVVGDGCGGAAG